MKNIILTTVAVAALTSSAFAAQTGQTYLKGGLGYGLSNAKSSKTTAIKETNGKKPRGFSGVIGAGYMLNDMLGVEGFVDYTSADAKNKEYVGANAEKLKNKFTESNIGLGGKVFVQHALAEKISVNAGLGAGVAFKSAKQKFSKTTPGSAGAADTTTSVELQSKNITQPFGLVSLGADYTVSEGVAVGLEYAVKFNGKKDYKTKKDYSANASDADLTADDVKKDKPFAKTSKVNQAIMATVKFAL